MSRQLLNHPPPILITRHSLTDNIKEFVFMHVPQLYLLSQNPKSIIIIKNYLLLFILYIISYLAGVSKILWVSSAKHTFSNICIYVRMYVHISVCPRGHFPLHLPV